MTEKATVPHAPRRIRAETRHRRAVGKAQLAMSAAGMLIVLAMLAFGLWQQAVTVFLLTVGLLEILFQRALVLFQARPATAGRRAVLRRERARPATAAE